jgi:hypothetical protein
MGAGRGGNKKYRQPAVEKAIKMWKEEFGDKPFTSTDLYNSGFITFSQRNQHISQRSVATIIGIFERKGLIRRLTDGAKKRQHQYQVI